MSPRLRGWVLLRLPLLTALLLLGLFLAREPLKAQLLGVENVHGAVKGIVEGWHALLLRLGHVPWLLAGVTLGGIGALRLGGWARLGAALLVALGTFTWHGWPPAALAPPLLVLLNLGPMWSTAWSRWKHLPGIELLLPVPVAASVFPGRSWLWPLGLWPGLLLFVLVDAFGGARHYEAEVADWPDRTLEGGVTVLDRAAPGVRCDFHDIDLVTAPDGSTRAVIVAETALQLRSYPITGPGAGAPPVPLALPPWWGPAEGLVMDSETDPSTNTTWFLEGPRHVAAVRWVAGAWQRVGRSAGLPSPLTHTYMRWIPERSQLVIVTVNARSPGAHPFVTTLSTPDLGRVDAWPAALEDGTPLPTAREIAWVPTLGQLAVAPDFGDRLYLLDLDRRVARPWVQLPAMDGKMEWIPSLGRLAVALPDRPELWLVDPRASRVDRRIPTQPGVRAVAVDAERGLLLTASVITGEVWVQDLADGALRARHGRFMPMVRELRVDVGSGTALLGTWTRLYRFPYIEEE